VWRPALRRSIQPVPAAGATLVNLQMLLKQPPGGDAEYRLLGPLSPAKHLTVRARVGETQIWAVTNDTAWAHPLHLHGFFFQVLDASGLPLRPLAWKDTVDIPAERTVRLIVRFDDREGVAGSWMVHCHILDHAEGGLMGMVEVGEVPHGTAAHDQGH
jgi:FtsP/CotA-like multicopper oxidase with cupredoxin domain